MAKTKAQLDDKLVDGETKAKTNGNKDADKKYVIKMFPPDGVLPVPHEMGDLIKQMEHILDMPVWLLVQPIDNDDELPYTSLDWSVKSLFNNRMEDLTQNKPIALIIDSPGGQARPAYQIATLLQKRCGNFTAIIPRYAKSAATLLALGATDIILGDYGELGPLDAQIMDIEREEQRSALDEVQSLERLQAFALEAVDQAMFLLVRRTGKNTTTILPHVLTYISHMMRPLLEKIDTVHYTQSSRILKVAEAYAIRLLKRTNHPHPETTARQLVESYPEHGFVIDAKEAEEIGLPIKEPDENLMRLLNKLYFCLEDQPYPLIGDIREAENDEEQETKLT